MNSIKKIIYISSIPILYILIIPVLIGGCGPDFFPIEAIHIAVPHDLTSRQDLAEIGRIAIESGFIQTEGVEPPQINLGNLEYPIAGYRHVVHHTIFIGVRRNQKDDSLIIYISDNSYPGRKFTGDSCAIIKDIVKTITSKFQSRVMRAPAEC